jgi:cold shock CspA family protein
MPAAVPAGAKCGAFTPREDETCRVNSGPISRLVAFVSRLLARGRGGSGSQSPSGALYRGTVAFWHSEDGWGAVRTPDRPGIGFAHFSHIRGIEGYRDLQKGQAVEFEWADDFQQDGCQYRVAWVRSID